MQSITGFLWRLWKLHQVKGHPRRARKGRGRSETAGGVQAVELRMLPSVNPVAADSGAPSVPVISSLTRDSSEPGFTFVLTGTADPASTVTVMQVGSGAVGSVSADSTGHWTLTPAGASLADGRFEYVAAAVDAAGNASGPSAPQVFRPNFVLINLDDLRADALSYMPNVNRLLVQSGTTFTNSFTPTSLSGPSRASLLTGLYAEHTGVLHNSAPLGGTVNFDDRSTLATWLHDAGYRTGLFGKYETNPQDDMQMASHPGLTPPPGWDDFAEKIGGGQYYGSVINHNGQQVTAKAGEYSTDVFADYATDFAKRGASDSRPFFLYFAPLAPHDPPAAAPRHAHDFDNFSPAHPPSYLVPGVIPSNLHGIDTDRYWEGYLETLQSADDAVQSIYTALDDAAVLDNTVVLFTGDNGLLIGEHSWFGKNTAYEESLRVPLVVRDGRQPAAATSSAMALNVDIASTLLDLAGLEPPGPQDGRSLLPALLGNPAGWRTDFPVFEYVLGYLKEEGVRSDRWLYTERSDGLVVLFDLLNDPYELQNLAGDPGFAEVQAELSARLNELHPADDVGPTIAAGEVHVVDTASGGHAFALTVAASDAETGGSQLRSPEFFIDELGDPGTGMPVDKADAAFDSTEENATVVLDARSISALAEGDHTLYVHARDADGNWGPALAISFSLSGKPDLVSQSDTGESDSDDLTVDETPAFAGSAPPGAEIRLFAASQMPQSLTETGLGSFVQIGAAIADPSGSWQITSGRLAAAEYRIYAETIPAAGSVSISAGLNIHLAADMDSKRHVTVKGTGADDVLRVDAGNPGAAQVIVNNVLAGVVSNPRSITMLGMNGNDRLEVDGTIGATLNGGSGDDSLQGGSGNDVLAGASGWDVLQGGPGNDRYNLNDAGAINAVSKATVAESSGEGVDTLDFGSIGVPVQVDLAATDLLVARYDDPLRYRTRTVEVASPEQKANFEKVIGGTADDVLRAAPNVKLVGGLGNNRFERPKPIQAGGSGLLNWFAVAALAPTKPVSVRLRAAQGTLTVNAAVANGVKASGITGNGTGDVILEGTVRAVNTTLAATNALIYRPRSGAAGLDIVSLEATSAGGLVERDTIELTVNNPPVLTGLAPLVTWTEGAAAVLVCPGVRVSDADPDDLPGGILTVKLSAGGQADDRLEILPDGTVTLDGAGGVFVSGIPVGTMAGGMGLTPLTIAWSAAATPATAQSVLRRLVYSNVSDAPSTLRRTVWLQTTDGDGGTSVAVTKPVAVVAVNDLPAIGGFGDSVSWTEGAPPVPLAPSATLTDPDWADFAGGWLTVTLTPDGDADDRLTVVPGDGVTVDAATQAVLVDWLPIGVLTGGTGTAPLTIAWNSASTPALMQRVLRRVSFSNVSQDPHVAQRVLSAVLTDGDGGTSVAVTKSVAVVAVNDPPAIGGFGDNVTWTEGTPPVLLAASAMVTDPDSADLAGGKLTVTLTSDGDANDRLAIAAGDGVTFDAGTQTVSVDGVAVGTTSGGTGTSPLVVTWNSAATPAVVQRVVRRVGYSNASTDPGAAQRGVSVQLTDGDGGATDLLTKPVTVVAVSIPPTIGSWGSDVTWKEGTAAVRLAGSATVSDADSLNFGGGVLTVSLTANGRVADLLSIRNQGTGAGQVGVSGNQVSVSGVVIGTFGGGLDGVPLTVAFNTSARPGGVQALVRALTFSHLTADPTSLTRGVSLQMTDGDGGTSDLFYKQVLVIPVNDAPAIGDLGGDVSYFSGQPAQLIAASATVLDLDSPDFDGGRLVVKYVSGASASDRLEIQAAGPIGVDAVRQEVSCDGIVIGTYTGGTGLIALTINWNDRATPQRVQAVLRALSYRNVSPAPSLDPRQIQFTLFDGDGGVSAAAGKQIQVALQAA